MGGPKSRRKVQPRGWLVTIILPFPGSFHWAHHGLGMKGREVKASRVPAEQVGRLAPFFYKISKFEENQLWRLIAQNFDFARLLLNFITFTKNGLCPPKDSQDAIEKVVRTHLWSACLGVRCANPNCALRRHTSPTQTYQNLFTNSSS